MFMLRGRGGRGNGTSQLICPQRGVSMNTATLGYALRRANSLLTECSRCSSDHLFPHCMPPRLSAFSPGRTLQNLFQPSLLTFKTLGFKPHWLQELTKFSPSHFPNQWLWRNIFCVFPCEFLSLSPLYNHSYLLSTAARIRFSPKPCLHTSYLLWCGLFSTYSCGVCSASLQVNFWGI